jgi:hypothetical protein
MEELVNKANNFQAHLHSIDSREKEQLQLKDREEENVSELRRKLNNLISKHGGLQNLQTVNKHHTRADNSNSETTRLSVRRQSKKRLGRTVLRDTTTRHSRTARSISLSKDSRMWFAKHSLISKP